MCDAVTIVIILYFKHSSDVLLQKHSDKQTTEEKRVFNLRHRSELWLRRVLSASHICLHTVVETVL